MPHKGFPPSTLDLFEGMPTAPTSSNPACAPAKLSELTGLSDARLAQRLGELLNELQRRMQTGRDSRPELEQAVRSASLSLERLVPHPPKSDRRQRSLKASSSLQEGQRKAVRAALLAGVAPNQVARHFGLSLAAVRKVLADAARAPQDGGSSRCR
jgi:ABC-type transporter Mla subunit MlaD